MQGGATVDANDLVEIEGITLTARWWGTDGRSELAAG